jgi:hypothetical protein
MNTESYTKLKAAFIAGRLDASLAMDRGRLPVRERQYVEMLLSMTLGDADLKGLMDLCEVLFGKGEDQLPSDLGVDLDRMQRDLLVRGSVPR